MASIPTQPNAIRPTAFEQELKKIDEGLLQFIPKTVTIMVNGTSLKQPQIDSTIQGFIKAFKAVDAAKQAYADAVNGRKAISLQARTFYKGLKAAIKQLLGPQSPQLSSFGIPMDKPRKATNQTRTVAQGKAAQTRAVRGTKGKKQRLAVKVVGEPSVTFGADGQLQVGPRAVNLPAASDSTAPAPESNPAPTPAPAGSGSGTPNSGTGAA